MTPEQASKLTVGERVWVQADILLPSFPNGIYEVLAITDEKMDDGRRSVRVLVARDPEVWARPGHLGRISAEQQRRIFE